MSVAYGGFVMGLGITNLISHLNIRKFCYLDESESAIQSKWVANAMMCSNGFPLNFFSASDQGQSRLGTMDC